MRQHCSKTLSLTTLATLITFFVTLSFADDLNSVRIKQANIACTSVNSVFDGERRDINIGDYDCIQHPADLQISSDGQYIAFVRASKVAVITSTNEPVFNEPEVSWSPRWDSRRHELSYLTVDKAHNVYIVYRDINGLTSSIVKRIALGAYFGDLNLSPDGNSLLFSGTKLAAAINNKIAERNAAKTTTESEPIVVSALQFKADGDGYISQNSQDRIFKQILEPSFPVQLTGDAPNGKAGLNKDSEPAWSPDGSQVAFIREYPDELKYRSDIWITSANNGTAGPAMRLTRGLADRRSPAWSKDGGSIAYLTADERYGPYGIRRLAIVSISRQTETILTHGSRQNVLAFRFSRDGEFLYYLYAKSGGQYLARVSLTTHDSEDILSGDLAITSFDVSYDNQPVVVMNELNTAPDIYAVLSNRKFSAITNFYGDYLAGLNVASKTHMSARAADGTKFDMFVTKPANFNARRKYPAILHIHGGPQDEHFHFGFDIVSQLFATSGYIVVEPNPPGSLGQQQPVVLQIFRNWGCTERPAVLSALDQAIAHGQIDADRVFVTGYSYGGYLTNCVIGRAPTRFRAAASGAGHSFVAANFGPDMWLKWYVWELGPPWRYPRLYDALSPIRFVGNVRTPTLFLSGDLDWNVPIYNSELMYQALKLRGVDSELIVFPRQDHSNWSTTRSQYYYSAVLKWFNKYR